MRAVTFRDENREKLPYGTFILYAVFIIIGIITYDGQALNNFSLSYVSRDIIDNAIRAEYALYPVLTLQQELLTYHMIHFALVHYAYSGFLLLYYISGFERITNAGWVIIGYFLSAVLWPVIGGSSFFFIVEAFPSLHDYLYADPNLTFLGSSVGIWGLIGLAGPAQYKRRVYWIPVVLLLFLEFTMKIIVGRTDLATNVLHVMVFVLMWVLSALFLRFENNDGDLGGLKFSRRSDKLMMVLAIPHIVGLFWHMFYIVSIA